MRYATIIGLLILSMLTFTTHADDDDWAEEDDIVVITGTFAQTGFSIEGGESIPYKGSYGVILVIRNFTRDGDFQGMRVRWWDNQFFYPEPGKIYNLSAVSQANTYIDLAGSGSKQACNFSTPTYSTEGIAKVKDGLPKVMRNTYQTAYADSEEGYAIISKERFGTNSALRKQILKKLEVGVSFSEQIEAILIEYIEGKGFAESSL